MRTKGENRQEIARELVELQAKKLRLQAEEQMVVLQPDLVQLGVDGWKMRYYTNKFMVLLESDVSEFQRGIK
jgi:5'-3' exonuclease